MHQLPVSERRSVKRGDILIDSPPSRHETYNQEIQQADTHPKTSPQDVDDRDQDIPSRETVQTGDKLSKPSPDGDEREEDGRRVLASPPTGNV